MSYSVIHNESVLTQALALTKGCYQVALLHGSEALSGATLKGKAKKYGARYKQSAMNLLKRCKAAGLPIQEEIGAHGKRLIVIGMQEKSLAEQLKSGELMAEDSMMKKGKR